MSAEVLDFDEPESGVEIDEIAPLDPPTDPIARVEPKVTKLSTLVKNTKALDDASYLVVCEQTKAINALLVEVDETFDPIIAAQKKALDDAKQSVETQKTALEEAKAKKAKHRGPLEHALLENKAEIIRYINAAEAAAAKKKAEDEASLEREAAERRAADVDKLVAADLPEEAAALAAQPLAMPVTPATSAAPKAAGITPKKSPKATAIDVAAFVIGIADRLMDETKSGPPVDAIGIAKAKLNAWATARKPDLGFPGVEAQTVSAGVTDLRTLVLAMAPVLKARAADANDPRVKTAPSVDVFEVQTAVLNKWVSAQGTALNWPGVTVEMVTDVSASRRG
jgi:hypothetical protein